LAAVNALGANQREHALGLADVKGDVAELKTDVLIFAKKPARAFGRSMSSSRTSRI